MFHNKLSILDRSSASHQPIVWEDYVLGFNGEIYNYRELARSLPRPINHPKFDGEVLIGGYLQLGDNLWPLLDGDFAIVLYDRRAQSLTLVTDRAGVKPLFFARSGDLFHFASEAKAILGLQTRPIAISKDRLVADLLLGPWSGRQTSYFEEVEIVSPGEILKANRDGISRQRYWNPPQQLEPARWPAERLADELIQAVRSRFHGREKPCLFLSGGIDSSLIAVNSPSTQKWGLRAYTTSYDKFGTADDELHVRLLTDQIEWLNASTIPFEASDVSVALMDELTWHLEEPVWDPVYMAVAHNYKTAAAEGFRVVVTGQGADEMWDGYHVEQQIFQSPPGCSAFANQLYDQFVRELKRPQLFFRRGGIWTDQPIFGGPCLAEERLRSAFDASPWSQGQLDAAPDVNRSTMLQFSTILQRNLAQEDRLGMAASVESRVPYLSNGMIELAFSCPAELKTSTHQDKLPLRAIAMDQLPAAIVQRPKRSFPAPGNVHWQPIVRYVSEQLPEIASRLTLLGIFSEGLPLERLKELVDIDFHLAWRLAAIDRFLTVFASPRFIETQPLRSTAGR